MLLKSKLKLHEKHCGQQESNPGSPCQSKSQTTTTQILSRKSWISFIWWLVERFSGSLTSSKGTFWLGSREFDKRGEVAQCSNNFISFIRSSCKMQRREMTFCWLSLLLCSNDNDFGSFTAPFKMPNGKSADTPFPLCGNCFLMPKFFQWPMTSTFAALRQSLLKRMCQSRENLL